MDRITAAVPQTSAGLQIVYLDFDGAETSYNGEKVTVSAVSVRDAGLEAERIAGITAALNALYASQGVVFVTEIPAEGVFSTVHIGKTDAFAPYGSFAGIAETVDTGNQIPDDKAFVLLDFSASDEEITALIAHETDHLLGTLDHGGAGLDPYAAKVVGPGVTSTGLLLTSNTIIVSAGGTLRNTTVSRKGAVHVSNGGIAEKTTIGGFEARGKILSGGTAVSTTVNSGGGLDVCEGGTVQMTRVNSGGYLSVESGARADSTTVAGGYAKLAAGAAAFDTDVNGIKSSQKGSFDIYGTASNGNVGSFGDVTVRESGTAFQFNVNENGVLNAADRGSALSVIVNSGGLLHVQTGGSALSVTVREGGLVNIASGGVVSGTELGGAFAVFAGGTAKQTDVVSGGNMWIYNGGCGNSITVHAGGSATVTSGASAVIKENGGYVSVEEGAEVTFVSNVLNGLTVSGRTATVHAGTYYGYATVDCGGVLAIYDGGVVDSAVVVNDPGAGIRVSSGGSAVHTDLTGGYLEVFDGGVADAARVEGGFLKVHSGGFADSAAVTGGGIQALGSARNTLLAGGYLEVLSGGEAVKTDIDARGYLLVGEGGTASNTIIRRGGGLSLEGTHRGTLEIEDGAMISVAAGAVVDFTIARSSLGGGVLVNDLSRLYNADFSVTVTADQALGTYKLAAGAAGFDTAITVKNLDGVSFGELVLGESVYVDNRKYTLSRDANGILMLDAAEGSDFRVESEIFQSGDGYEFTVTASVGEIAGFKIGATLSELGEMPMIDGNVFVLGDESAGSTWYYQTAVFYDDSLVWSNAQTFDIADRTAPEITGTPLVTVEGENARFSWEDASDNVGVTHYILTVDGREYTVSDNTFSIPLAAGTHSWSLCACDEAGLRSSAFEGENFETYQVDFTAPVITSYSLSQGAGTYTFTAALEVSDNSTAADEISYRIKWATTRSGLETATVFEGKSFTLNQYSAGETLYYQVCAVDSAGNEAWTGVTSFTVADATAPVIGDFAVRQASGSYVFDFDIEVSDNKTSTNKLVCLLKYASTEAGLQSAQIISGKQIRLTPAEAGQRFYYQVGVQDEAGNVNWSNVNSFDVKDVTAPVFSSIPAAAVKNGQVTISWARASDNVDVAGYRVIVGSQTFTTTAASCTVDGLEVGTYVYQVQAFDEAGNVSEYSAPREFSIQSAAPVEKNSVFKWAGASEYAFVQLDNVTASDFKRTITVSGEVGLMVTRNDVIDAEKDFRSADSYYLYANACWAAAAANMFVNANWHKGIFNSEDDVLKYFVDSFSTTVVSMEGDLGISTGATHFGLEFLLNGYQSYWESYYSDWSSPSHTNYGGFYKETDLQSVLGAFSVSVSGAYAGVYQEYVVGTGVNQVSSTVSTSKEMFDKAFALLKEGYSIGLSLGWYDNKLASRKGGHAITVYGFTYDESKKGENGFYTGVIVADSDDDFTFPGSIQLKDDSDRLKVLEIEYNAEKGVYVFTDYGVTIGNGVVESFQYLAPWAGENSVLDANVEFAQNADWNASYSIGKSETEALDGGAGRIAASEDVYVALNLANSGLGVGHSENVSIRYYIDGRAVESALPFGGELNYGESTTQVINVGKLANGLHSLTFEVMQGGKVISRLETGSIYVAYASSIFNNTTVSAGSSISSAELAEGVCMTVEANGFAGDTVVTRGSELLVQANGVASGSLVYGNGTMTVAAGGSISATKIFKDGFALIFGKADKTVINDQGTAEASQNSLVTNTLIARGGTLKVSNKANVVQTTVNGVMELLSGKAENTEVSGTIMLREGAVAQSTRISNGKMEVYSGAVANSNTVSGRNAIQNVLGKNSLARGNQLEDGAVQVVTQGGRVENNILKSGAQQQLNDGATAYGTQLYQGAVQIVTSKAVAYDTVVRSGAETLILNDALTVNCVVEAGGVIQVGNTAAGDRIGGVKDLKVQCGGQAVLETGSVLYGKNTFAGTVNVKGNISGGTMNNQDAAASVCFDFTERSVSNGFIINNISYCQNVDLGVSLKLSGDCGKYRLSEAGSDQLQTTIAVYDEKGKFYGNLNGQNVIVMGNREVSLLQEGLSLSIVTKESSYSAYEIPEVNVRTQNGVGVWEQVTDGQSYVVQFSRDNFATVITVRTTAEAVTMNNLSGDIQWRVRSEMSDVWTNGENFTANAAPGSTVVQATKNWELDMLFANSSGVWEDGFSAQHQGAVGSWQGTQELVSLCGKNKVDDLFEGSSDANVLLLSDDINGDALFVDDIYSKMAALTDPQARLCRISEIRAGKGDDIIDMTSQRFAYSGPETSIYGGEGNDIIWGGAVSNRLFGDSGDDRLVGASGDDILAGGSGNDSMHGGGGSDIFTFGGDWGNDTVEQLAAGSVTLWFKEGSMDFWDAAAMTYSDGKNSVRVSGTADVTLVFGKTDELGIEGAFGGEASSKIFSEVGKGMLA